MAKVQVKMPDDIMDKLSRLGEKTDQITEAMLMAGGDVVLEKVRSNLESVLSGKSSGELKSSLGKTSVGQDRNGNSDIKIGFREPRKDGSSNAMIANIIEYGKHNQPARPFLAPAKRQSRNECVEAMKRKFDEEVDKL